MPLHQARIEFDLSKPSDARKSLAQAFGLQSPMDTTTFIGGIPS